MLTHATGCANCCPSPLGVVSVASGEGERGMGLLGSLEGASWERRNSTPQHRRGEQVEGVLSVACGEGREVGQGAGCWGPLRAQGWERQKSTAQRNGD